MLNHLPKTRRALQALSLACLVGVSAAAWSAPDPSVDQVYSAAQAGHYDQAQSMMRQVLQDHPNSAKAHFVEAELLAGHGDLSGARAEFSKARGLDSTLSFAKPEAVQSLQNRLYSAAPVAPARPRMPSWVWLVLAVALIVVWIGVRNSMRNRMAPVAYYPPGQGGMPGGPMGPGGPMPMGGPGYGPGYGMPSAGSGILGSLATGAAVGAGIAAGEALVDRVFDHNGNVIPNANAATAPTQDSWSAQPGNYDMGGQDFGLNDDSSWGGNTSVADDSSGDSWDSGGGGGDDSWS